MLERLVYISAAREPQTPDAVARILDVSRQRNASADVTGLLIGGNQWWMQLLEGETPSLEPVWQSIRHDPRHDPVVLVLRRPIDSRDFAGWSLQFRDAGDKHFGTLLRELTDGLTDERLQHQILKFGATFLAGNPSWTYDLD
ncbi:BLUF domain-containing protein [Sphingomonas sp. LHG3406-1]|uniref:BLUF domain-containing protein n=1 Tax=Sphingomonas sp. LHG3406-1 TaxID=2804617 RepID=UPI00261EA4E9|nr:BLUF domain-containing protein [Sphingomonas sp. LHG3406-1]